MRRQLEDWSRGRKTGTGPKSLKGITHGTGGALSSERNPFVDYLNSLRTQQADGNPSYVHETRQVFLDAFRAMVLVAE